MSHFYNKYSAEISEDLKKQMQKGIPVEVTALDIDDQVVTCKPSIQKWVESIQRNPDPSQFYTVQVNSFEDLKKRMEESRDVAVKINHRLTKDISSMN